MQIIIIQRVKNWRFVFRVDKMLALVPALRAETRERELSPTRRPPLFPSAASAVLANAVQPTDRKIDDLVYDIYGLTKEEIALVEKT